MLGYWSAKPSIIKSSSFDKTDYFRLSCTSGQKLFPKKGNETQWDGERKLIVLATLEKTCAVIIRVEEREKSNSTGLPLRPKNYIL